MADNLLQVHKASKAYGAKTLFHEASFSLNEGEHLGVIGANGAGKSTLFKCLIGELSFDEGDITQRKGIHIGYLGQEEKKASNVIVEELIQEKTNTEIWDLKRLGHDLGLKEEHFAKEFHQLSGGYRMRVQLLNLLGQKPDILLLDEPTNYLDLESVLILEKFLISYKGTFLLISHDREFLNRTTDHTLEIEGGAVYKFPGNIEDYFEQKQQIREILEKTARSVADKRSQIIKFTERFGAKASKAKQAQSKLKQLKKLKPVEIAPLPVHAQIQIPEPSHIGKQALSLQQASFGYDETIVLNEFTLNLQRGDHVAIVGVNGAGKSTLLKGIAGSLKPKSGKIDYGHQVELGYYAQHVAEKLRPDYTVLEEMQSAASDDLPLQAVKDLAGSLLFSGDDVKKKISVLSGGEKARVALGQILLKKSPVLLLDEPTNHLDFHTVEALTEALRSYSGTIVVVSHDRSFIGRLASKIIEIRDGAVELYPGSYDEYLWSLEKGSWSDKSNSPLNENTADIPVKKENHKRRQKEISKKIRALERQIAKAEVDMEGLKKKISEKTERLSSATNEEISALGRELQEAQEKLTRIEESWLNTTEELEKLKD